MSEIPGPRTHPTVKPLATMNNKRLRNWELRLGALQTLLLLGVVFGSVLCAFYLGAWSGKRAGFEMAREDSLPSAPKEEISGGDAQLEGATKTQDLYERLREMKTEEEVINPPTAAEEEEFALGEEELKAPEGGKAVVASSATPSSSQPALAQPGVRIVGGGSARVEGEKTLGALLEEENKRTVSVAGSVVTPSATPIAIASVSTSTISTGVIKITTTTVARPSVSPATVATSKVLTTPTALLPTAIASRSPQVVVKPSPAIAIGELKSGWYVQIAAPRSYAEADALGKNLKAAGFKFAVERAVVRGDEYFRIVVGPETSKELALRLQGQLKREKIVSGDPFVRFVK